MLLLLVKVVLLCLRLLLLCVLLLAYPSRHAVNARRRAARCALRCAPACASFVLAGLLLLFTCCHRLLFQYALSRLYYQSTMRAWQAAGAVRGHVRHNAASRLTTSAARIQQSRSLSCSEGSADFKAMLYVCVSR